MDSFPTEILLTIFSYLPQRYVYTICSQVCKSWNQLMFQVPFHATINIYSNRQLKGIFQLAKEKKMMNSKTVGYYVRHLVFHYSPNEDDIMDLSMFPNLQSIDGFVDDYHSAHKYKFIYLYLNQPSKFFYIYDNEQIIEKFNQTKTHLKSLHIYVTNKFLNFNPHHHLQQHSSESIYMKSIGSQKRCRLFISDVDISIKMLILPTTSLSNLSQLKIDFICRIEEYRYYRVPFIIDERTFENIHESCPLLESLSMIDFYMNISNKYYHNNNSNNSNNSNNNNNSNNKIIPAYNLKSINILSKFRYPQCFSYLTEKYPHLESLSLHFRLKDLSMDDIVPFQRAVLKMIVEFPLLKKLSYKDRDQYDEIWPSYQFFKRLNHSYDSHPYKEIRYPYMKSSQEENQALDFNKYNISLLQEKQQFIFLNQLSSLTLDINDMVDLIFHFFLFKNKNTMTVSTTLQELAILQDKPIGGLNLHLYDWLAMFPHLISFKIRHGGHLTNSDHFINNSRNYFFVKDNELSQKLNQLVKQRRQQHYHYHQTIYKLKYLNLLDCGIWFQNGLDELLKKCPQLKRLVLENINFIQPIHAINEIQLDLSHLYLELLKVNHVSVTSFNNFGDRKSITKLMIYESLNGEKRIIENNDQPRNDDQQFIFHIKCKFIEGLVYNI